MMSLADDIRGLRDRVLADLNGAHDYFNDTRVAWRIAQKAIRDGTRFTNRNRITGTITTASDLANKAKDYIVGQLAETTFQQFIAIFEDFFFELLRIWLLRYPESLGGKQIDFKSVLDAADKDAITLLVVNKELNEIAYDRPTAWFEYLERKVHVGCPSSGEVERFAEAKASRDCISHSRGIAGKSYESKAGRVARYRVGEKIDIPEPYHRETWQLIRKMVTDISDAAIAKAS